MSGIEYVSCTETLDRLVHTHVRHISISPYFKNKIQCLTFRTTVWNESIFLSHKKCACVHRHVCVCVCPASIYCASILIKSSGQLMPYCILLSHGRTAGAARPTSFMFIELAEKNLMFSFVLISFGRCRTFLDWGFTYCVIAGNSIC